MPDASRFSLTFPPPDGAATVHGHLAIDAFEEAFVMDFAWWSPAQYRQQWRVAAARLLAGQHAAFVTTRGAPDASLEWWPAWRSGERIVVQQQVLDPDALPPDFDDDPYRFVAPHPAPHGVSQWTTTVQALAAFVARLASVRLRAATAADVPTLAALYADAVRTTGPQAYTPEQVEAWRAAADEPFSFRLTVLNADVLVAEGASGIVGFCGLRADGYVSALYVRGDRQRQDVGAALLARLVAEAEVRRMARLFTEASAFSRGLFARHGFVLVEVERVERRGVPFDRYVMARTRA